MNGGPSGFQNAPVSRAFVLASGVLTIYFGIQGRSSTLGLSYQDSFKKLKIWKLIASVFAFSSTPELMFGLYLLYYFRVFERQIGSNKYSVFILFSVIVSSVFEVLALTLLKGSKDLQMEVLETSFPAYALIDTPIPVNWNIDATLNILTSGPYGLIFSSFVPFYFDIPVSTRFRIFGVSISDKSFIYLACLQLLFSSWKRSILPGICGILAGSLYRLNILRIRKIKFPAFIASFFSRLSLPSPGITPPTTSSRNVIGNVPSFTGRERNNPIAPPVFTAEPPEESITTLVSMGFDRNTARQALIHARNDINMATNILLESQSN
ncbi:hypothetical protein C5167_045570 [Papaver somniferum]|uniref:UBA domain-containing protein n=1 Tax=Papaver somniferum TaxID=3469 RepID=A0A4Y7LBC5_PAPSO|nr:hypothetical protein C5167_045570 [Papaver somniferum]